MHNHTDEMSSMRLSFILALGLTAALLAGCSSAASTPTPDASGAGSLPLPLEDFLALTNGVTPLPTGEWLPSTLAVTGDLAFPLLVDDDGDPWMAFGRRGAGRFVVSGHETPLYFGSQLTTAGRTLIANCVRWAGGGVAPSIGVQPGHEDVRDELRALGFAASMVAPADASSVDVYAVISFAALTEDEIADIDAHLIAGGGALAGGTAWWFPTDIAATYPGNALAAEWGVQWTSGYTETASAWPLLDASSLAMSHAGRALASLAAGTAADPARASRTVREAARAVRWGHAFLLDAMAFAAEYGPTLVSAANPVDVAGDPARAIAVTIADVIAEKAPPAEIVANPDHVTFPGEVAADAPRISVTLAIDATHARIAGSFGYGDPGAAAWRSTGRWAAAGDIVTVDVPPALIDAGFAVQIGAHSDDLWQLDTWMRHPDIVRRFPIDSGHIEVASAFGGPVYVTVPVGAALGAQKVTIAGAIPMSTFVLGTTTNGEWAAAAHVTPFVELASTKFIMTVPASSFVRALADPTALMTMWDKVLDADAHLASISRSRPRAERFVLDAQISAGWMHAGYPIMGYVDAEPALVDLATIRGGGSWGPFHELGHNHQLAPSVIPGATEVTVNLWSVYASEKVAGVPRAAAWDGDTLSRANRDSRVQAYVSGGADYWGVWVKDPALALDMYLELQERFGWALFSDVFRKYQAMSSPPTDDQGRIDVWVTTSSRAAGFDLSRFYAAWGIPFSPRVERALADLPDWTDHPLAP